MTVDRGALVLSADYDSIGRALKQLVANGKLVRVGRGRYRKFGGQATCSASSIADLIGQRVRRSRRNVFLRADFDEFGSYDAVGRALRQQVQSGRLVQIGYGLYAKAELSPLTGKPAPIVGIRTLASEAIARLGKSVEPSRFDKAYNSGLSTQVPTGRTLTVNARIRRRIGYDGNYVVLQPA
ncbi:DUF6088 family protein [Novosphingobium mathurense]|uniref:DUF6088 family protein n=1 Tax=Novosphingobium mathurense TaxID=428990 RepID=UPI001FEBB35D|nr:DUF6088 family protein [Novosphingobium mathurense]